MKYYSIAIAFMFACVPINTQSMEDNNSIIIFSQYNAAKKLTVSRDTLQRIFTLKETHWDNGDSIYVFTKRMTSIEHKNFVTNVLCMTLYNYQTALLSNSNSKTQNHHITEVDTDADMFAAIHSHTGSIGYVNYDLLLNSKVIKVCADPDCSD
jgi:ABC-type phosphate transport system substrate-binding protein